MARLNKRVKLYIVRSLAMYETPTETMRGVQEVFGIDVTKQQCEAYDPTKKTGQDLSEEFKTEFYRVRKEMNDNLSSIPIANIAYRLKRLQRFIDHEQFKENPVIVPSLLEQAAKEVGGLYTNRKEITGAGGGPVKTENTEKPPEAKPVFTPEELKDLTPQELSRLAINGKL
ncbi:DUF2280 domain-containing protein [Acinetobacter nosocomialis]|uniref:DUF2280 domain-containing protein n=1 Tax=Acinetobacter nosocomialis TaxID=106654 RepID=UPI0009E115C6|nr:DUF2280 domain-containing protein [Acinetobacter nosocomialis]ARG16056.1 hypothetical protein B7L44_05300 [Acinetobacter nosocomialis]MCE5998364.1 DUF2280 domain-containing protein [Acinetobacter nosocomialis]